MRSERIVKQRFNPYKILTPRDRRMCQLPQKTEKWKSLSVTLTVSLLTALLIVGWKFTDCEHVLSFSANLKNRILNRRWQGLESIDNSIMLEQRNNYQWMLQISVGAEKPKAVVPTPHVLLLIFLIVICTICQASCEEHGRSFSGTRYEEFKKIFFILLLVYQLPIITACDSGEYEHNGVCCSLCSAGNIVSRHCTLPTGTTCKPCTAGEYIEHPNGLEKCFKCKTCDQELGLQINQECTYTRNTVCEPKKGYYCIEHCQMAQKHKTCPPGQGVKEKGTHLKDTVCEVCPDGTFSSTDSSTEECKKWRVCEELKLEQVQPGSSEVDVTCEKKQNVPVIGIVCVVTIVLVAIAISTIAVYRWRKHKTGSLKRVPNEAGSKNTEIENNQCVPLTTKDQP